MPYTTWWIEGDLSHTETLIETHQRKFTFVSLDCSVLAADDFTKRSIENSKNEAYQNYKHRDDYCDVNVKLHAETGENKFTLKNDNMEIPWMCKNSHFWFWTLLPLPFFNGALIRWYINNKLSIEERRNIVRFVMISPGSFNQIKPPSDSSRGFQQENARFYDETELSIVNTKNDNVIEEGLRLVDNNSSSIQPSAPFITDNMSKNNNFAPAEPITLQNDNNFPPPYAN